MSLEHPQVDSPRGIYQAKVDDKGRLKLPSVFLEYLQELNAKKLFVTTTDMALAKIYTIPAWNANLRRLEAGPDKKAAKALKFRADNWGQDSEVDPQGRVMLPTNLRRHLKVENAPVWLQAGDGVISVMNEALYNASAAGSDAYLDSIDAESYFNDLGLT